MLSERTIHTRFYPEPDDRILYPIYGQINKETGWNLTPEQAKENMRQFFPTLKRWKEKDERTLTEKATACLHNVRNDYDCLN